MKKIFLLTIAAVLLYVSYSSAAAEVLGRFSGPANIVSPSDIVIYSISDNDDADAIDTIGETGDYYVAGPFPLSQGNASVSGFQGYYPAATVASGDSITIDYQVLPSLSIDDTISGIWTAADTVTGAAGKVGNYQSLASTAGASIVFRVYGLDATSQLIAKRMRIVFKKGETFNK